MLYASYFDVSGKPGNHPYVTIAGAGSTEEKWGGFEDEWSAILQRERVSEFHATDFAASVGEYTGWKGDRGRRSRFLRDLIAVVQKHANKLFTATIEMPVWHSVNATYELEEHFFSPYAVAGMAVASQTIKWAKKRGSEDAKVAIVFEDGDAGWEGLTNLCKKYLHVEPVRLPKAQTCAFQIGDMLAWKTRVTATNVIPIAERLSANAAEATRDYRRILREIRSLNRLMVVPANQGILSRGSLLKNCQKFAVPRRRTAPSAIAF